MLGMVELDRLRWGMMGLDQNVNRRGDETLPGIALTWNLQLLHQVAYITHVRCCIQLSLIIWGFYNPNINVSHAKFFK